MDEVRRAGARRDLQLTSSCLLVLGPAGAGKTHLFTRLRRQAGKLAVFVHTRPQIGVEPTPAFVLRSIVESLKQPVIGDDQQQIEIVAGAILAAHQGDKTRFPLTILDDVRRLGSEERRARFDEVLTEVEDRFPGIWAEFLLRLLSVPFAGRQDKRALLTWLSGDEPSAVDLERIGASGGIPDARVMSALSTLGIAAAYGAPIVLVFDQLENLAEDEGKTGRIRAHARLVSDLRDTVHGLTIVQMALDSEWSTRIHPALHAADRDRLEETREPMVLPTPEERRALLEAWRDTLPEVERARPFPYPFRPADVQAWMHERGMTPRMLLQAIRDATLARASGEPEAPAEPTDPGEQLAAQWDGFVARARIEIDGFRGIPAERLAGGLYAALHHVLGLPVEATTQKPGPLLRVTQRDVTTEILIAQQPQHTSLAAVIRAATRAAGTPGKRVLLVRERAHAIPPTWREVPGLLAAFTGAPGATFVHLDREDAARLLAIEAFVTAARSQDISAEDGRPIRFADVLAWAIRALDCAEWGPIRWTLSANAPAPDPEPTPVPPPASVPPPALAAAPSKASEHAAALGPALSALSRLRVASIERLVREARALDPTLTRAAVVAELRRNPVRFFGESIVALPKGAPVMMGPQAAPNPGPARRAP